MILVIDLCETILVAMRFRFFFLAATTLRSKWSQGGQRLLRASLLPLAIPLYDKPYFVVASSSVTGVISNASDTLLGGVEFSHVFRDAKTAGLPGGIAFRRQCSAAEGSQ